jgi:hypothetical protein
MISKVEIEKMLGECIVDLPLNLNNKHIGNEISTFEYFRTRVPL